MVVKKDLIGLISGGSALLVAYYFVLVSIQDVPPVQPIAPPAEVCSIAELQMAGITTVVVDIKSSNSMFWLCDFDSRVALYGAHLHSPLDDGCAQMINIESSYFEISRTSF